MSSHARQIDPSEACLLYTSLAAAGIEPTENPDKSRKLIIPTTQDDVRLLIVRATDVPTSVEHGAADLGVAGKDVLMEYGGQGIYCLLYTSRCV